jgi:hypothetical protein
MQIRKRDAAASKIDLVPEQARQLTHHDTGLRQRRRDCRLVRREPHHLRPDDPLEDDGTGDALEQVPIIDIHDLVHASRRLRVHWCQAWRGQCPVQIPQDCLRLIEAEPPMIEDGDTTERMPCQMRFGFQRARGNGNDPVRSLLFLKRCEHSAGEGAAGDGTDREDRHRQFSF